MLIIPLYYLIIGGMLGVVAEYSKGISPEEVNMVQTSISYTYQDDFSKYSSTVKHKNLFLKEHPACPFGIRFPMQGRSLHDRVLSIPLFLMGHWERLVNSV
jgi:hypothetical protein